MDGGMAGKTGTDGTNGRYAASPLVAYDRAVETAKDLLVMEVSVAAISFEIRRQHGFSAAQADVVIREASALVPRQDPRRDPSHRDARSRLPLR